MGKNYIVMYNFPWYKSRLTIMDGSGYALTEPSSENFGDNLVHNCASSYRPQVLHIICLIWLGYQGYKGSFESMVESLLLKEILDTWANIILCNAPSGLEQLGSIIIPLGALLTYTPHRASQISLSVTGLIRVYLSSSCSCFSFLNATMSTCFNLVDTVPTKPL